MDANWPLLSVLIWLPILGGLLTLAFGDARANQGKVFALAVALATFAASLMLFAGHDYASPAMRFVEDRAWIPSFDIRYHLGVDGLSIALILLTTLTTVLVLVGAWGSVERRAHQYFAAFLVLEGLMVGVFAALDAMLFYVFFEGMLIPMFIIIGVWGGPKRVYASIKFFLYTFLGSVFMLIGLVYLYLKSGSYSILDFQNLPLFDQIQPAHVAPAVDALLFEADADDLLAPALAAARRYLAALGAAGFGRGARRRVRGVRGGRGAGDPSLHQVHDARGIPVAEHSKEKRSAAEASKPRSPRNRRAGSASGVPS